MNQRIKQIIDRCGLYLAPDNPEVLEKELEFFAEEIVRECMLICGAIQGAGELRNMHEFASGAAQCKGIIKRDFGVEE